MFTCAFGKNIAKCIYLWELVTMTYQCGPKMKDYQKQVFYGTMLGGSSLILPSKGKNCYLAMRDNDELWLQYKIEALRDFFKIDNTTIKKDKNTYRCYSTAYPAFNDAYSLFYKNKEKIVTLKILDTLTDDAWATWFIDSARKSKRKIYLRTNQFGAKGTQIISDYFNSLDCSCDVHKRRERHEIVFDNSGSYKFLSVIAPKIPDFLISKYE